MSGDEGFGPVLRGGPEDRPGAPPPGGYGPAQRGRVRPRRWGRRLMVLLTLGILVMLLAIGGTATALLISTNAKIERIPVQGLTALQGRMNVLVVGTDSREGLTAEELQALGTEAVDGQRTDTVLLLTISGGRAAMLSFPRDLFVTRCDGTEGRINSAYGLGGPDCLVRTVTASTGIPISHYVEVNFFGFIRVVDAVGGVSLWLDEPMVDRYAGVDLPAGCVHLDGKQALGFVRARRIDSDLGRVERQQRFIRELAAEVTEPSTLTNVPRLFAVTGAAAQALRANDELGTTDLLRLARGGRGLAGGGVASYSVPGNGQRIGGAAVLVPAPEARDLFARFADGRVLTEASGGQELRPEDVELNVLNGAGVEGLAARAQDTLQGQGFRVTGIGNAEPTPATVVLHPPGMEAAAALIAAHVPGATAQQREAGTPVTLLVGADGAFQAPGEGAPLAPGPESGPAPPEQAPPGPADC